LYTTKSCTFKVLLEKICDRETSTTYPNCIEGEKVYPLSDKTTETTLTEEFCTEEKVTVELTKVL